MSTKEKTPPDKIVQRLINELSSSDGSARKNARLQLIGIGKAAIPGLIEVLSAGNRNARWEATKVLRVLKDTAAAAPLVEALKDDDVGVRWSAMEGLIYLEEACLEPLLMALTKDFSSVWLREGAHYILRVLNTKINLDESIVKVMEALEGPVPAVGVAWAAEKAWEALYLPGVREPHE
jgi:HEAT repeat protein